MRVGVIASMKQGLEHFIYRELNAFSEAGLEISLFPTKYAKGMYNPKDEWRLVRWSYTTLLLSQLVAMRQSPARYVRLLIEAIATGSLMDLVLAWHFSRQMANIDVIYATFGDHKLYVGYYCKRILGKPLAVMIHAYELYKNPNPRLFQRALSLCDQIITVTEYNKELLQSRFAISPERVEVVRISVDTRDYNPEKRFIVLIVSFFVERKGHEVLFKAIKELDQDDIEVWVVGSEGSERPVDVRRQAKEIGVESKVAFFGPLAGNALKAVYRACDVFCLPCRFDSEGVAEGFPTVLAEAMAFSKPIITTRHVEIPRIVKEIVVDENDVHGLALALRRVYDSPSLRQDLGERNRKIAEELFTTRNAGKTASILERLRR